ncbi:MAG: hypothetical protein K5798_02630 [Nitrosopumilus sp.]|uniref:hypothetical protein n=1 Tax=Nitrosopumilus sp. TaxID=2024843 RepID=UPI0024309BD7|nr:hypothetical protein [Nitrosopumilus sp.]MCV0366145.1 hypothetical protein [Nitrosopumilus sp.]
MQTRNNVLFQKSTLDVTEKSHTDSKDTQYISLFYQMFWKTDVCAESVDISIQECISVNE